MIYTGLFHSYWQNMQPIKSVLPFCSALPIQYTPFIAVDILKNIKEGKRAKNHI